MAKTHGRSFGTRLINSLVRAMTGFGLGTSYRYILTVPGRKTGRLYSTPVDIIGVDGQRWLVAGCGPPQFGSATPRRGRGHAQPRPLLAPVRGRGSRSHRRRRGTPQAHRRDPGHPALLRRRPRLIRRGDRGRAAETHRLPSHRSVNRGPQSDARPGHGRRPLDKARPDEEGRPRRSPPVPPTTRTDAAPCASVPGCRRQPSPD
jgi:hypothetical protein